MKYLLIVIITFLVLQQVVDAKQEYILQGINKCENGPADGMKVQHSWNAKTRKFTGSIDLPFEINNKVTYAVTYYTKVLGKWVRLTSSNGAFCQLIQSPKVKGVWTKAAAAQGDKLPSPKCPIPKGHYQLKNFLISTKDLQFQVIRGEHKVEVKVIKDNKEVLCREIIVKGA